MKKYQVEIKVLTTATTTVKVEARNVGKAMQLAKEILNNSELDWNFELNYEIPPKMSVELANG